MRKSKVFLSRTFYQIFFCNTQQFLLPYLPFSHMYFKLPIVYLFFVRQKLPIVYLFFASQSVLHYCNIYRHIFFHREETSL